MDVNQTYCGYHFTIYVSQAITLYTLNLYSAYVNHYSLKLRICSNKIKINHENILRDIVYNINSENLCNGIKFKYLKH